MKTILLSIAIIFSVTTHAQVKSVSLQASGLTCSMCSNSINKALKTLDFIEKVDADIKTYTFKISFKPNSVVDFDLIRKIASAGTAKLRVPRAAAEERPGVRLSDVQRTETVRPTRARKRG